MERTETLTAAAAPATEMGGSYVDWPAILGGTVVAAAIAGLFTTFGAALGLSTISAEPGEGSGGWWLALTGLWVIVSLIAAFMAGGYVAGRMRRRVDAASADEVTARDGINGLIVWSLATLLSGLLAISAIGTAATAVGSAVGGVAQAAGTAVGGVAQAAGATMGGLAQGAGQAVNAALPQDDSDGMLDYIADRLLRPAIGGTEAGLQGAPTPAVPADDTSDLARQAGVVLANVLRTGEILDDDRAFLVAVTADATDMTEAEVEARVDQAVTQVQEARTQAMQAIDDARAEAERIAAEAQEMAIEAAEAARKAAILSAFLLTAATLVAAAAAVAGSTWGGRHRDEGRVFAGFVYRV